MSETLSIIPRPKKMTVGNGRFHLHKESTITCSGKGALDVGQLLAEYLRPATGFPFPVAEGDSSGTIRLEALGVATPDEAGFVDERYTLTVNDSRRFLAGPERHRAGARHPNFASANAACHHGQHRSGRCLGAACG